MATLSDVQIIEMVKTGDLVINPFDESLVEPASYDLRLGSPVLASPLGPDEPGKRVELSPQEPDYSIQTGQMVAVLSLERLEFPLDVCSAGFGIRSGFAGQGINAFGGVQLDPGWRGHVTINLQNVGPEPVKITFGKPLFTVAFSRLETPASRAYDGDNQDQDTFPQRQIDFILSAHTTSLAEIPTLRQQVAHLTIVIEELEERLPDLDEGLELKSEIEERLMETLKTPREKLLSSEEAWRKQGI